MTAEAAPPRGRSIAGLVLLVTIMLAVSFGVFLIGLDEPRSGLRVNSVFCRRATAGGPLGPEHQIALPYASDPLQGSSSEMACRFEVDLDSASARDMAMFVPSFADAIAIRVNGERLAVTDLYLMRNLRFVGLPAFVPLTHGILRPGHNRFEFTMTARLGRWLSISRIYLGPVETLRPYYQKRWLNAAVLPTLVVGGDLALAMVFALVWAARRRESLYGWLAVLLGLGAARGSVLVPDFGLVGSYAVWNIIIVWEAWAFLMYMLAAAGVSTRRASVLLAVPPAILFLLYFIDPSGVIPLLLRGVVVLLLIYFLIGGIALFRAARRGNRDAIVVIISFVPIALFVAHDGLVLLAVLHNANVGRSVLSGLLITICILMTLRFVGALRQGDQTAESLRRRVAEAEDELRKTYEELRVRREAEAVEQERARLMRDLHDGVGGELASMLALADPSDPRGAEIAGHARAALADMRLIIGSLEDYGGDLALALGAWRERAEPQVRAAGLTLSWRVDDLPALPGLGPAQVLDVLRIVQEAVTNVIKHARAARLTVAAYETDHAVAIAVRDDGGGIGPQAGGNGLRNMALRAARLGAALTFGRNGDQTELVLTLPRNHGAAGSSPAENAGKE